MAQAVSPGALVAAHVVQNMANRGREGRPRAVRLCYTAGWSRTDPPATTGVGNGGTGRMQETGRARLRLGLVAAMVVAPFLALLYGANAALVALCAGLLATAFLALDAARRANPDPLVRRRLHAAAWINVGLALLAGLLLLWRVRS